MSTICNITLFYKEIHWTQGDVGISDIISLLSFKNMQFKVSSGIFLHGILDVKLNLTLL